MVSRLVAIVVCVLAFAPRAGAQEPYNLSAPVKSLATIFTDLYGPRGLVLDSLATLPGEQPHSAHFNSDFQFNFSQFTTALVSQLVSVPLPSPASGFTYHFDTSLGVFQRTTQGFGPILADRAETIGARRVSVGFAFQRFTFDTVEGLDLRQIPAVFTHDNAALLGGREDVVTTTNAIEANDRAGDDVRDAGHHRPLRRLGRGTGGEQQPEGRLRRHGPAPRNDERAHALLPAVGWSSRRASGLSPPSAARPASAT